MDFNKLINKNGIYLYEDNNFNTITIKLNFFAGTSNRDSAIVDLLSYYIMSCNKNFKNDDEINKKQQELYSLEMYFSSKFYSKEKIFSLYTNMISPNVINDDYYESAFNFINKMLKEPDFTNEKMLEVVKRNLISDINMQLKDNEIYSSNMYCQKVLYDENREYDYSTDINFIANLINSITLEELKKQYEYIINNFHSGLVFGNINEKQFNNFVENISLKQSQKEIIFNRSIRTKKENINIERESEQSYIYVIYDIDHLTYPELLILKKIMNSSLGLCYQTLREKYGLVYNSYSCIMHELKKLYIYGEIDKEKKDKFLYAANEIINKLKDKKILEKLITQAKKELEVEEINLSENQYKMINSINDYIIKLHEGKNRTEIYDEIHKITSEELIKSTKTLKRKNIFMVRGNKNE